MTDANIPLTEPAAVLTYGDGHQPATRSPSPGQGQLLRGSAWLVLTLAASALGGLVFWLVAARLDTASDVGRAAALFTSVLLVNYATSMGLPVAVARYSPDQSEPARVLFSWALMYAALASVVGTAAFFMFVPASVAAPLWEWGRPVGTALFFLTVTGTALTVLVDVRLMAMRRWGWVLFRTLSVVVLRMPLLWFRPVNDDALWLFLLVAGVPGLSGLVAAAAVEVGGRPRPVLPALPDHALRALRYAFLNYLSMLAAHAPQFVLPVIVLLNVSPSTNASFYVAWSVAAVVFLIPHAVGQVLLVEGGKEGARLTAQFKLGLVLTLALTGLVTVASHLFSELLTAVYGQDYREAARLLPTLVGASMAWAVTSMCLADARVREETFSIVVITVTFGLVILLPAAVLTARYGADGAAEAWLVGNIVAAAVSAALYARAHRRLSIAAP